MPDESDKDKRTKAYFFQVVALGVFALVMMAAAAKLLDVQADFCDLSDAYDEANCAPYRWLLSGCILIMAGAGVAVVVYCCDCNPLVKFAIVGLLVVGAICYFISKADSFLSEDEGALLGPDFPVGAYNAHIGAVAVGLFLTVVVTSVQIVSEAFNDEKRRVPAFAFAMLMFGLLYPWYLFEIDPRVDSQNAIIAGCVILDIALIATMIMFACKEVVRIIRIILCAAIFAGSLIMFAGLLDYYGIEADDIGNDDTGDALRVIAMEPGIFCLIQSGILALDVLL